MLRAWAEVSWMSGLVSLPVLPHDVPEQPDGVLLHASAQPCRRPKYRSAAAGEHPHYEVSWPSGLSTAGAGRYRRRSKCTRTATLTASASSGATSASSVAAT